MSDEDNLINGFRNYHEETPLENAERKQKNEIINYLLENVLTPTEAKIIKMQFGIGMNTIHDNKEIGLIFDVGRGAIKVRADKALRKLRHPTNSVYLKEFLDLE